ncbi:LysR family transcriptional regulator [Brevundimonas goettingensis]|uniref:LysR family transcriptional regulator n=1 Tax=Brevundimonas goettingensis TaxID=2774190 RepID=A0A975BZZ0_9CAUL|nr:LysR family transcriptional regulator [Brevundimonas goettingensis]QTC90800.1 LysR family transcriptional regulator [Brevundimonas goettingensis]
MKPSLDDLALLVSVARHRGFRRAAAEHGLSPSSLSERIRALEDGLGTRLLNRTTRSVSPTEAGEALIARVGGALEDLDLALAATGLPSDEPVGRLRINAPGAAEIALGPLIAPFLAAHPGVQLELVVDDGFTDVIGAGFDAGVRYGESLDKDMIAVPLGAPERFVLVAAPSLLERVGTPDSPEALAALPCIRMKLPGGVVVWEFEKDDRVIRIHPEGAFTVTDRILAARAAVDGLGFHATFSAWAEADIAAGRLVSLFEDWLPPFEGPFLYYPSRRHPPPALAAFVSWLRVRQRES